MTLTTYPLPKGIKANADYRVRVRQINTTDYCELAVYNAKVRAASFSLSLDHLDPANICVEKMAFCSFSSDFSSPVEVEVTCLNPYCKNIKIRPVNTAVFSNNNVHIFFIKKPQKLSIEFDGDLYHNLFLFADSLEQDAPDPQDENVIYFPAGVHDAGEIHLKSNQTLYLAGGAYVYGLIRAENADNITICGKGIICGEKYPHELSESRPSLCRISSCNNVTIRDITLLDSPAWTCALFASNNITIDNVKEITYSFCSDGFDICGCSDLLMTNVFARNCDDCISLKSYGPDNRNIVVRTSIFWDDCAHALLVGPESARDNYCIFENILFEDIVILCSWENNPSFMGALSLMCTDNATFRNITFRNITVSPIAYGMLLRIKFVTNYASTIGKSIENITFENIRYSGPMPLKNIIEGTDDEHRIKNLRLKNFYINGRPLTEPNIYIESNEFAEIIYEVE